MSAPDSTARRSIPIDVTSTPFALSAGEHPIAIHCNAASTIVGALTCDKDEATWILPAGRSEYAFRSINTTSTTKTGMRILL
jgi:hypothetical protein